MTTADLIGIIVAAISAVAFIWYFADSQRRIKKLNRYCDALEAAFLDQGGSRCTHCGKHYNPLNDPDYIPELNLCRDCLWKLHYDTMFEQEKPISRQF